MNDDSNNNNNNNDNNDNNSNQSIMISITRIVILVMNAVSGGPETARATWRVTARSSCGHNNNI